MTETRSVDSPPTSLRRVFWLTFLPLAFALLGSFAVILMQARRVGDDTKSIYEENREFGLARHLQDEIAGIQQWLDAADKITDANADLVMNDARKHLAAARQVLSQFDTPPDAAPVSEHEAQELDLVRQIGVQLAALDPYVGRRSKDPAQEYVTKADRFADQLADRIETENKRLGGDLDQRADDIVRLVVLLGLVTGSSVLFAAVLFRRRVLAPLAQLEEAARRFGEGHTDLRLLIRHRDELGTLAVTMQTMAERIRAHQQDLEARVAQRSRELLRTARLADLGTLAAGVAHEINNPLAAIATCAEGLLRGEATGSGTADSRMHEYLQIIGKEAMRARDTTARLLAFARPESGRREPVWLARELREVAAMLDHSGRAREVRIEVAAPTPDEPVLGDAADLRQVLFNLLKNALDASPAGGSITLRVEVRDDRVLVEVADQGSGIDSSLGDRIFEPFVTTKEPGAGTGLGLAISHRIVTDHGGSLRAENRAEGGALFVVDLPRFRQQ